MKDNQANVIMKNNTTMSGMVINTNGDDLILIDHLRKTHILPINDINEIIIDKEAAF